MLFFGYNHILKVESKKNEAHPVTAYLTAFEQDSPSTDFTD